MTRIKRNYLAALAVLLSPMAANADIIMDFEGVVADNQNMIPATPYTEDGFVLTSSSAPQQVEGIFGKDTANTNGSAIFGWCTNCNQQLQILTVMAEDGGVFDFVSFDGAGLYGNGGTYQLTGYLEGGGSVSTSIAYTGTWSTYALNWSGLTSFDIYVLTNDTPDPAMDNLVFARAVPEPGTLALLGLGLAGIGFARRRKA